MGTKRRSVDGQLRDEVNALSEDVPPPSCYKLSWSARAAREWRIVTFHRGKKRRYSFRALEYELEAELDALLRPEEITGRPDGYLLFDALQEAVTETRRRRGHSKRHVKLQRGRSALRRGPLQRARYEAALAYSFFRRELTLPRKRRDKAVLELQDRGMRIKINLGERPFRISVKTEELRVESVLLTAVLIGQSLERDERRRREWSAASLAAMPRAGDTFYLPSFSRRYVTPGLRQIKHVLKRHPGLIRRHHGHLASAILRNLFGEECD